MLVGCNKHLANKLAVMQHSGNQPQGIELMRPAFRREYSLNPASMWVIDRKEQKQHEISSQKQTLQSISSRYRGLEVISILSFYTALQG